MVIADISSSREFSDGEICAGFALVFRDSFGCPRSPRLSLVFGKLRKEGTDAGRKERSFPHHRLLASHRQVLSQGLSRLVRDLGGI
jgi:hypothetical protein